MSYHRFDDSVTNSNHRTILNFDQDEEYDTDHNIRSTLLKECGHITRSEQLIDEQYDIALKAREDLIHQRTIIKSMQNQYNAVTNKFQVVNDTIRKIYIRRRRETIILAVVFGLCLGFLIYNIM